MLVKAKWSVKDSSGWHNAGELFNTDEDLGDAVEAIEAPVKAERKKPEPEEAEKSAEKKPDKPAEAPRTTRRKNAK